MVRRVAIVSLLMVLLAGCQREEEVTEYQVRGAQSGFRVSFELLQHVEAAAVPAVPALSAVRAGALMSRRAEEPTFPPPLSELPASPAEEAVHDAELLQRIIELLRQDVREMLNVSSDRTETLKDYLAALSSHFQRGEVRRRALRDHEDNLRDDENRLQRGISDLRNDLDEAIRGGEGKNVSALMTEITERYAAFAVVQTSLVVVQRSLEALDRVVPTLEDRLRAVQANQEALIKGVRIIDIPGVEDLGIIVVEDGRPRIRGR